MSSGERNPPLIRIMRQTVSQGIAMAFKVMIDAAMT
jgi:hypothetical protein